MLGALCIFVEVDDKTRILQFFLLMNDKIGLNS